MALPAAGSGRHLRPGTCRGRDEPGLVEPFVAHHDRTVRGALPRGGGAVDVDLHAVAFRIVEVHGLAHEVVGAAGERDAVFLRVQEPSSEVAPAGEQERRVEQAGLTWRPWPRIRVVPKDEERGVARPELHGTVGFREDAEPQDVPVEPRERAEVAHDEGHRTDPVRRLGQDAVRSDRGLA